jgi:hypothetical protein
MMNQNYKITINWGKYAGEYRATFYKKYTLFGFSFWLEYHYAQDRYMDVRLEVSEWLKEFGLSIDCVIDLTEIEA